MTKPTIILIGITLLTLFYIGFFFLYRHLYGDKNKLALSIQTIGGLSMCLGFYYGVLTDNIEVGAKIMFVAFHVIVVSRFIPPNSGDKDKKGDE